MVLPGVSVDDYLESTRQVVQAANRLRASLDDEADVRQHAITQLVEAAQDQDARSASVRAFMFEEAASSGAPGPPAPPKNALDTIAADLEVANVLIAAGEAVGETGKVVPPDEFMGAVLRLERLTESETDSGTAEAHRFGFEGEGAAAPPPSVDLPIAIQNFEKRADEVLAGLVSEAKVVVDGVVEVLSKVTSEQLTQALSRLGSSFSDLPKVGRLINQGIQKLEQAIEALIQFVGNDALAQAKAHAERFWKSVTTGDQVGSLLEQAFGIAAARTHVKEVLASTGLQTSALDNASASLQQLTTSFKEHMRGARGVVTVVSFGGTALALVPAIGAQALLVALAIDVMVLGWVLVVGADYTDHGPLLQRVAGIRRIADGVRPS